MSTRKNRFLRKTKRSRRQQRRENAFKKATCNVANKQDNATKEYSCYDKQTLLKLRNMWNARHPDVKIKSSRPKTIWKQLRDYQRNTCNIESCWLDQSYVKHNIHSKQMDTIFAPSLPSQLKKDPDTWLTSIDLEKAMKDYEKKYSNFCFIGPSPLDYDTKLSSGECVWDELCNFDLRTHINNGIKTIGVIFNLDKHYEVGSHWVAVIIDLRHWNVCFFCSYGSKPETEHTRFMETVKSQAKEYYGKTMKECYNPHRYQKYTTNECGIYCMYVIIQIIKGKRFYDVVGKTKKKDLNDAYMNTLRTSLFYNKV